MALTTPGVDAHRVDPDPAHRDAALAAGPHPAQGARRRGRRRRLAAGPGVDDLPGRGRGPLARPLRDPDHLAAPPARPARAPPSARRRSPDDRVRARAATTCSASTARGETAVHALRGVSLGVLPRRARRGHGPVRLRQVDAAQPRRRARRADGRHACWSRAPSSAALSRAELAALRRRSVGYVFQDFNLIPALTAAENVALPRELDGVAPREARREALAALDEVGLDDAGRPLPGRAVRRPAAAGRDRPRAGRPAPAGARRRADRRARQPDRRVGAAAAARPLRRRRLRRAGHARGAPRRLGRPRRVPARRRDGRRDRPARRASRPCSRPR